ncbi:hypothetical protein HanPI659440_Chr13g0482171 [Helianthus annuus]|nr:hypothetical protein HanPI659440_Chr13g0482171 [Helianthus annuus]
MQPVSSSPGLQFCVPAYLHCVRQPYPTMFLAPSISERQRASASFLPAEICRKLFFHIRSPKERSQSCKRPPFL